MNQKSFLMRMNSCLMITGLRCPINWKEKRFLGKKCTVIEYQKKKKCCCSHSFYMGFVNRLFLSSSSRSCEVLSVACFKYMYVPQIYFLRIWQTTLQIWNAHTFFTHQILCRSICASVTILFSEVPCFFFCTFWPDSSLSEL